MATFHLGSDELENSNKLTYPDNEKEELQQKQNQLLESS